LCLGENEQARREFDAPIYRMIFFAIIALFSGHPLLALFLFLLHAGYEQNKSKDPE